MTLTAKVSLPDYASTYRVPIAGAELAVIDYAPEGATQVVHLVHGFTGSKEDFAAIAPLIADAGFRVIAHDHRGCHQSSHTPGDYALKRLAADVIELEAALGISGAHLLGHSFGGVVAREAALESASTHRSLTLFCTGPAAPNSAGGWLSTVGDFLADKTMAEAWDYMDSQPDHDINFRTDGDPTSLYSSRWRESDSAAIIAQVEILHCVVDRTHELVERGIPVQVVYGQYDDAWPLAEQDRVAAAVGRPSIVIADAGHCPNEERPLETASALIEVWASL
ncbi:MAG: hypothetical protein RL441_1040 [Actinomycetota bacterium]|jgi:pimeloyl-ACP methyl ester carboxylesterase